MDWYQYFALVSLAICLVVSIYHVVRLIRLGKPIDYSPRAGEIGPAVIYSFTGAMSPRKKESAFLHLPTYSAGILYHLGTFLAILLFIFLLAQVDFTGMITYLFSAFFMVTGLCGLGILIKRMVKSELRSLSSPDDYISNILVTFFQLSSGLVLFVPASRPGYFILASLLLLYFPVGKLKHAIYFFAARYHLGLFYGWRGVWPPKTM
jgi:nitrate reductase gamma subunit